MPTPDLTWILTALAAAGGVIGFVVHKAWPWLRRLVAFVNDLAGEPARPGFDGRPGVMERIQAIEADVAHVRSEVTTNGGTSLRDAVRRIEHRLGLDDPPPPPPPAAA